MGVTHRVAPNLNRAPRCTAFGGERILASRASWCGWLKMETPAKDARQVVVDNKALASRRVPILCRNGSESDPVEAPSQAHTQVVVGDGCAPTATPCQAGPPAEFKHINKRRKRNLQGFP